MFPKILTSILLTLIAVGGFFVSFDNKNVNGIKLDISFTQLLYADATDTVSGVVTAKTPLSNDQTSQSDEVKKMYNTLVAGLNLALSIVTIIVSPAIMLAGWLMSPDWTSGDLFGLRGVMYKLWVTVSNITYFIYAVLLIFIALATIFGRENYGYKAMLPKLALGILMVPFTWWFVQWTISLASIVTASVISIPQEALSELTNGSNSWWNKPSIPTKVTIDESASFEGAAAGKLSERCSGTSNCISPQTMLSRSSGMYGHMLIYAYGVFKLNEVKNIDNGADAIKSVVKLIHDGFIAVIMLIIFGLLTIALIFMLLARAVMLWVYTIFSPFMTLELVMGGIMKKVSDDFSIKEFVGLAFVPALVGLALSFGLVVVAAVQSPITPSNPSTACTAKKLTEDGCTIASIMGNSENQIIRKLELEDADATTNGKATTINIVRIGGVEFTFRGKPTGYTDMVAGIGSAVSGANDSTSVISAAGGIFGTIIVDIIALLFIWMAFMAAKGVSKVVDAAAKPFEEMGQSIGKLGASLPKYTPIPGLGVSAKGMSNLASGLEQNMSSSSIQKAQESALGRALGANKGASGDGVTKTKAAVSAIGSGDPGTASVKLTEAITALQKDQAAGKDVKKEVAELVDVLRKRRKEKGDSEVINILDKSAIDGSGFRKLLNDYANDDKTITKENIHIEEFRTALLGAKQAGGTGTGKNDGKISIKTEVVNNETKYSLETANLNIKGTKDQIITGMEANAIKLVDIPLETLRKQLKDISASGTEIERVISAIGNVKAKEQNKGNDVKNQTESAKTKDDEKA